MQIYAYEFTCAVDADIQTVLQRHVKNLRIPIRDIISVTKREDGRLTHMNVETPSRQLESWVVVWREDNKATLTRE